MISCLILWGTDASQTLLSILVEVFTKEPNFLANAKQESLQQMGSRERRVDPRCRPLGCLQRLLVSPPTQVAWGPRGCVCGGAGAGGGADVSFGVIYSRGQVRATRPDSETHNPTQGAPGSWRKSVVSPWAQCSPGGTGTEPSRTVRRRAKRDCAAWPVSQDPADSGGTRARQHSPHPRGEEATVGNTRVKK